MTVQTALPLLFAWPLTVELGYLMWMR